MNQNYLELLAQGDAYEGMAASATSHVLRCRYKSLARYFAILAEDAARDASFSGAASVHFPVEPPAQQSGCLHRP